MINDDIYSKNCKIKNMPTTKTCNLYSIKFSKVPEKKVTTLSEWAKNKQVQASLLKSRPAQYLDSFVMLFLRYCCKTSLRAQKTQTTLLTDMSCQTVIFC